MTTAYVLLQLLVLISVLIEMQDKFTNGLITLVFIYLAASLVIGAILHPQVSNHSTQVLQKQINLCFRLKMVSTHNTAGLKLSDY